MTAHVVVVAEVVNVFGHGGCLLDVAHEAAHVQGLAIGLLREHLLGNLTLVVAYETVGSADDVLGGTVVLFELEEFGSGV